MFIDFSKKSPAFLFKFALILSFILAVVLFFVWPYLRAITSPPPKEFSQEQDNKILRPRTSSVDAKKRPYSLGSKEVEGASDSESFLTAPFGEMTLEDQTKIRVRADKGYITRSKNLMELQGNVCLETSSGYSLVCPQMTLNFQNNDATSESSVSGHGPAGYVEAAGGLHVTREGSIHFKGSTYLIIQPQRQGGVS